MGLLGDDFQPAYSQNISAVCEEIRSGNREDSPSPSKAKQGKPVGTLNRQERFRKTEVCFYEIGAPTVQALVREPWGVLGGGGVVSSQCSVTQTKKLQQRRTYSEDIIILLFTVRANNLET